MSGLALAGIEVALLGRDSAEADRARTDQDGRFLLRAGAAGEYRIEVQSSRHRPFASAWLALTPGDTASHDVILVPHPTELPAAEVKGEPTVARRPIETRRIREFYARKNRPDRLGVFVTLEEIERWNPRTVIDLLHHVRGVKIEYTGGGEVIVYFSRSVQTTLQGPRGWCPPLYFIDGLFMGNAQKWPVDQLLAVDQVEGIEVYNGPGNIPAEFNRTDSQCGVIAFWTR